jgi:excisionase family DNA binding protein
MSSASLAELVEPLLVPLPQAARILAISERTLFSLTVNGDVKAVRIGRAVRYSIEELRRYVDRLRADGGIAEDNG